MKKVLHRAFGGGLEELSIPDGSGSHPDSPAALFEEVIASHDDREKGAGLSSARGAPGAGLQGATGEWGPLLTNAGTFQTRKVEIRRNGRTHTTLWLAEEIPVLGLARIEMQGIVGMEVHSFGTDGKSLIDREPPHPGQTPPGAN